MNQQELFDVLTGKVIMEFRLHLLKTVNMPVSSVSSLNECTFGGYGPAKCKITGTNSIGESGLVILDGYADFLNTESSGVQTIAGHVVGIVDDEGNELIAACRQAPIPLIAPMGNFRVMFSIYAQSYIGVA